MEAYIHVVILPKPNTVAIASAKVIKNNHVKMLKNVNMLIFIFKILTYIKKKIYFCRLIVFNKN